ncbi:MAG: type II secretion system F family protein, partial [Bdellovibrionales bacterium]|nr:type II secretion system F family protein [Bdellovibrionales bacterium]
LPMVMERIVMAIQTGLDIIAGITTLVELQAKLPDTPMDPVTRLLELAMSLSKAGMRFDEALREVAQAVDSSALRHAFVHLAMAQQDGGELVMPLRELSDATQLYYQETVDEEVARMPIKATLPLVLTFAGLIICFITSPLMQIINLTKEMTPGGL